MFDRIAFGSFGAYELVCGVKSGYSARITMSEDIDASVPRIGI